MNFAQSKYTFGLGGILALFLGGLAGGIIPAFINVVLMFINGVDYQHDDFFLLLTNVTMWLGAILAFDFFVCRSQTGKPLNFNFSAKNTLTYTLIFPLMLGMMLIAEFITGQIPTTGKFWGDQYQKYSELINQLSSTPWVFIFLGVVIAPIFEEIVFRGIIQKGLINKGWKPINAIWFSAVFFGLVHGNPWQLVGAILLGYVLGLVYHKTKSLLMPILLHAFNNGISVLLLLHSDTESFLEALGISEWIVLGLGIIIFSVFYYLFTQKYNVIHKE